jgi:chemotaxis protein methyltransferase CheR
MIEEQLQIIGMPDITDREFRLFRDLIHVTAGVDMNDSKRSLVRGRLLKRLRHYNIRSYKDYYDLVTEGGAEAEEEKHIMVDLLTTHETYFFREPEHFRFIQDHLIRHKNEISEFRLWVAAASSGEEAYSAAMVIDEVLGDRVPWEIPATDVSRGIIEVAKSGIYPMARASNIPDNYLKKYCRKGVRSMDGLFSVSDTLRKKISFSQANLLHSFTVKGLFDIIMLRNVMIYFNNETKADVIGRLTEKLKTGGFLIIGHSESLNTMNSNLKWHQQSVYQKK